ncbi:MAG TPA: hypothetical protein VF808_16125 [Ktedonobacterales bacterium]
MMEIIARARVKIMLMVAIVAVVAILFGLPNRTAAASGNPPPGIGDAVSLQVLAPVPGQVVTTPTLALSVVANGYKLDAAFAGTPNLPQIGHYHEMLDGRLVDMTPLHNPGTDTISMVGLMPGAHTLTIVPANNDHSMIMSAAVNIPFTYAGSYLPLPAPVAYPASPAVTITSPASGATVGGASFFMSVSVSDFALCGSCFGKDNVDGVGHWHIFLDQPMMSNMLTMAGDTTQEVSLKAITPGWHTFYAVLVNDQHMPLMGAPNSMTSVTLYVSGLDS